MFCPNCGKDKQKKDSYCRSCGEFLPDFEKIKNRGLAAKTPEENIKTSLFLSGFSSLISFIMAILLIITHLGKENTHPIIYLSAAFFIVIGVWQIVNVSTGLSLKKQFDKRRENIEMEEETHSINPAKTAELLNEADFSNAVPASVTEKTTRNLTEKVKIKSTQTEH